MSCALCQSNSPLQNSHVIPEFFYTELYDKFHRFHTVPFDAAEPERFKQKGIYEKLLCKACEQKFSVWEKYAKEAFCQGIGIQIEPDGPLLKLSNLDYRKFRLFLLSLLWRMGVSSVHFFSLVNLGSRHEEILRLALLNEDPLEPLQYPCLMAVVHDNKLPPDWISQPMHMKSVVINGMLFQFYVTSHSLPAIFADACISKKNEMRIVISEIQEIPFLAKYLAELGNGILSRR